VTPAAVGAGVPAAVPRPAKPLVRQDSIAVMVGDMIESRDLYVVGDVHGHLGTLMAALHRAGLTDPDGGWTGGDAHLWFLGDYVDRGADGLAVIDLVMRLTAELPEQVHALLGNHEILMLGKHRWDDTLAPTVTGTASFARSWARNGGQAADIDGLTAAHVDWLATRPVAGLADDHLLVHSDTISYLDYGDTVEEVNKTFAEALASDDLGAWWECWRRLTTRYAFRGQNGTENAEALLSTLGGTVVVHGHSTIPEQADLLPWQVEGPFPYADGLALNVDGGIYLGGPCLVVPLPFEP